MPSDMLLAAGYVVRKVLTKYKERDLSEEVLFLFHLSGDERTNDGSERWTDKIDRGGLWHDFFCAMEEEIRRKLANVSHSSYTETDQMKLTETLLTSEDVLFHWAILSHEIEDEKGQEVLKKIVKVVCHNKGTCFCHIKLRGIQTPEKKDSTEEESSTKGSRFSCCTASATLATLLCTCGHIYTCLTVENQS